MATTMHWLPKRVAASVISAGLLHRGAVDAHLVGAGQQNGAHVVDGADAAAHGEGDEDRVGHAAHHVDDDVACLVRRRDVKKDQFVGAFTVVDLRLLHRIAGVDQVDEVDAFDHPAVLDIQTGNDAFCEHASPVYYARVWLRNAMAASSAGNCSGEVSVSSSQVSSAV